MKKFLFVVVTVVVIYFVGSHYRWWGDLSSTLSRAIPGLGWGLNPCELVTQADVEAALGRPMMLGLPERQEKGPACMYTEATSRQPVGEGQPTVEVTGPGGQKYKLSAADQAAIRDPQPRKKLNLPWASVPGTVPGQYVVTVTVKRGKCGSLAQFGNPQGQRLTGLGDEAIDDPSQGLSVRKGATCFSVATSFRAGLGERQMLAKKALGRLAE